MTRAAARKGDLSKGVGDDDIGFIDEKLAVGNSEVFAWKPNDSFDEQLVLRHARKALGFEDDEVISPRLSEQIRKTFRRKNSLKTGPTSRTTMPNSAMNQKIGPNRIERFGLAPTVSIFPWTAGFE